MTQEAQKTPSRQFNNNIGKQMKRLMAKKKITQACIARTVNMHEKSLSRAFRENNLPAVVVYEICKRTGRQVGEYYSEEIKMQHFNFMLKMGVVKFKAFFMKLDINTKRLVVEKLLIYLNVATQLLEKEENDKQK